MCPYLVSSKIQSLCSCYHKGLMCPSLRETQDYCVGAYKNCPHYPIIEEQIRDIINVKEEVGKL